MKKETLFDLKKTDFFSVQKIAFFFKGVNPCWPKNFNFLLFKFDLNKPRNNA